MTWSFVLTVSKDVRYHVMKMFHLVSQSVNHQSVNDKFRSVSQFINHKSNQYTSVNSLLIFHNPFTKLFIYQSGNSSIHPASS